MFADARSEWTGHGGGDAYVDSLCAYFQGLSHAERHAFAELLVAAAAGNAAELRDFTSDMAGLVTTFAFKGYGAYLRPYLQQLVDVFNTESNIQEWLRADDSDPLPSGIGSIKRWHYFLGVSAALRQLRVTGFEAA